MQLSKANKTTLLDPLATKFCHLEEKIKKKKINLSPLTCSIKISVVTTSVHQAALLAVFCVSTI